MQVKYSNYNTQLDHSTNVIPITSLTAHYHNAGSEYVVEGSSSLVLSSKFLCYLNFYTLCWAETSICSLHAVLANLEGRSHSFNELREN